MKTANLVTLFVLASSTAILPLGASAQGATKAAQTATKSVVTSHHTAKSRNAEIGTGAPESQTVRAHTVRMSTLSETGHDKDTTMRVEFVKENANSKGKSGAVGEGMRRMPAGHDKRWSHAFDTGHDAPTSARVELVHQQDDISKPAQIAHRTDITTLILHKENTSHWEPDEDASVIDHDSAQSEYMNHHDHATSVYDPTVAGPGKVTGEVKELRSVIKKK